MEFQVKNISKKFCKDLKKSLWYGLSDLIGDLLLIKRDTELRNEEFWSLKDVSFELTKGDCLAIIGHNGAGKSTLLKIVNGLIQPQAGEISYYGKIVALIELSAGFNPILTGRENIHANASLLGLTKKEIEKCYEDIVEFSELKEFIDSPVKYYSSGMRIKLGFSIAAFVKPDVLILDEVFAVGDAGFRIKSFNKINEMIKDSVVLFVSHSLPSLSRICNKCLYLSKGKQVYFGDDLSKGISLYYEDFSSSKDLIEYEENCELKHVSVNNLSQTEKIKCAFGDEINISIQLKINQIVKQFNITTQIVNNEGKVIVQHFSDHNSKAFINNISNLVQLKINEANLVDGNYFITFFIKDCTIQPNKTIGVYRNYIKFQVHGLGIETVGEIYPKVVSSCEKIK